MKKILFLLTVISISLFAQWEPIEAKDDFGEGMGVYLVTGMFEDTSNIYGVTFYGDICGIICRNNEFDWNYGDDIKMSIKRESGKVETFYSKMIKNKTVSFSFEDTEIIAKIFKEENKVDIAIRTNDDVYVNNLDLVGFTKLYNKYIAK